MDNIELACLLAKNNKKYELIETITVTEDDVSVINRTQEPDGTEYDFERIYIELDFQQATENKRFYVTVNGLTIYNSVAILSTSTTTQGAIEAYTSPNGLQNYYRGSVTNYTYGVGCQIYTTGYFMSDRLSVDKITNIEFSTQASIPVGSTIKIYAVRR